MKDFNNKEYRRQCNKVVAAYKQLIQAAFSLAAFQKYEAFCKNECPMISDPVREKI